MKNFEEDLYKIFYSRDERYAGRFYVGIKTTGIYCKPICSATPKKRKLCLF